MFVCNLQTEFELHHKLDQMNHLLLTIDTWCFSFPSSNSSQNFGTNTKKKNKIPSLEKKGKNHLKEDLLFHQQNNTPQFRVLLVFLLVFLVLLALVVHKISQCFLIHLVEQTDQKEEQLDFWRMIFGAVFERLVKDFHFGKPQLSKLTRGPRTPKQFFLCFRTKPQNFSNIQKSTQRKNKRKRK